MEIFGTVSEEEMVSEFLKAEINSPERKEGIIQGLRNIRQERSIIDSPNLLDSTENYWRTRLLGYRGYKRNELLFKGFPTNMQWQSASLTSEELMKVKYLNDVTLDVKTWIKLSGGTRTVGDAVRRVIEGKVNSDDRVTLNRISLVKGLFKQGASFPKVILVGESIRGQLIILEGHVRITAFLMSRVKAELAAIVGSSKNISEWHFY